MDKQGSLFQQKSPPQALPVPGTNPANDEAAAGPAGRRGFLLSAAAGAAAAMGGAKASAAVPTPAPGELKVSARAG